VEESLSDAAFLWTRLDQALAAPDHTLPDVERWVERRLFGALDGVRLGGSSAASPLLSEAFVDQDPGLVSVAAYLLATISTAPALSVLEDGLRQLTEDRVSAVARGLGRAGNVSALRALWSRLEKASAACRASVLEALAFCGEAPDADWKSLLLEEHSALSRAVASALAFVPSPQRAELMWLALRSSDLEVRSRSNMAALIAGDSAAWHRCRDWVRACDAELTHVSTMLVVAMLGSRSDHALLCKAVTVPALKRDALWALSFAGSCDAVEAALNEATAGDHRALACGAIASITGVNLSKLAGNPATPPLAESNTFAEAADPSSLDADAIARWWERERQNYNPDARYQNGKLKTFATLREGLAAGATNRRHERSLELAIRSRGACRVRTLDFCAVQRRQMAQLDSIDSRQLRETAKSLGFEPLAEAQ
jgi:uncharacterized protein (TIGR02270 family)